MCASCTELVQTNRSQKGEGSSAPLLPPPGAGAGKAGESPSPEAGQAETREHKTHSSGWHLGAQLPGAASVWPWGRGAGAWRGQSRSGGRDCGKRPAGQFGSAASGLVAESKFYLESVLREVGIPVRGVGGGVGEGEYSLYLCAPDSGQRETPELPQTHPNPGLASPIG